MMIIKSGFWTSLGKIRGLCQSEIQQIEATSYFDVYHWCHFDFDLFTQEFHLSFQCKMYPFGGGNPAFSGYVICRAYLRCLERETLCKGISTQNIVPVVYQDRGRGEGKAICLVA